MACLDYGPQIGEFLVAGKGGGMALIPGVNYGDGISQIDMDSGYKFHEFKSREEDLGKKREGDGDSRAGFA